MIRTVYSSDRLTGNRRTAWQKVIREVYTNLEIEIGTRDVFHGRISRWLVGDAELTEVSTDKEFARRTARHISLSQSRSYIYLYVRNGLLSVTQAGRQCEIGAGQYTLLNLDRPYVFHHAEPVEKIGLKVPTHMFRLREAQLDARCAIAESSAKGVGRLAAYYINQMCADDLEMPDGQLPALSRTAADLLSLLFDGNDGESLPDDSAIRSGVRKRSMGCIAARYSDIDLDPESIAKAVGVSVRYLHRCFESTGKGVMQHLTEFRLVKCHGELADPAARNRPVSEIARRNGFRNVSHFSDAFKNRFGITARDVRAAATAQ